MLKDPKWLKEFSNRPMQSLIMVCKSIDPAYSEINGPLMFTLGGLETLPTGEVLDKIGEIIPKLFATGRTTAGLPRTGKGYV